MTLVWAWLCAMYCVSGFILGLAVDEAIDTIRWRRRRVTKRFYVAKKAVK